MTAHFPGLVINNMADLNLSYTLYHLFEQYCSYVYDHVYKQ